MVDKTFQISDNFWDLDDIVLAEEIELISLEVDGFCQMPDVNGEIN